MMDAESYREKTYHQICGSEEEEKINDVSHGSTTLIYMHHAEDPGLDARRYG